MLWILRRLVQRAEWTRRWIDNILLRFCLGVVDDGGRVRLARVEPPDRVFYRPVFSPWLGYSEFSDVLELSQISLGSRLSKWNLYCLARQCLAVDGEFWEAGVYRGGTAAILRHVIGASGEEPCRKLRLFDTFEGMPETDSQKDVFRKGSFSDTSLQRVVEVVGDLEFVDFRKGFVPDTFDGLEECRIAFAHIDVDISKSVFDCCMFIYPRMPLGGVMVFDDYGMAPCPGAREAVDRFFADKPEVPLALPTGQALVFKIGSGCMAAARNRTID